jgi:putative intracellular protease/amidase
VGASTKPFPKLIFQLDYSGARSIARIIFPLPSNDFDPSEVAVSWRVLTRLGHRVSFTTPNGQPAQCDPIMITGRGLDVWGFVPILRRVPLIGLILRANAEARSAYAEMVRDPAYNSPLIWTQMRASGFDAILLGGGHRARGMRQYIESDKLQKSIADFFKAGKPVAAICHGVLLVARSKAASGRSVLHGYKTTALTWRQEKTASALAHVGRFWDRNYYRTYLERADQPKGYMSVQQEVTRALARPNDFMDVPTTDPDYRRKTSGISRDTLNDERPAWVVRDRNYVSARWPGDAHTFAKTFARVLEETVATSSLTI